MIEQIAKTCHEVNRAYCQSVGDFSQLEWDDAPEWQKESAINGVKFYLQTPDSTPSDIHENWLSEKLATGWKYGPVKNVETKEHPCIVPYSELPLVQQFKDALFIAVVRSFDQTGGGDSNSDRPQSFGEQLVGMSFNPGGNEKVNRVKQLFAEIADIIADENNAAERQQDFHGMIYKAAIMDILSAQMMSVKFLTLK